jgi:hypothetical protein
MIKKTTKATIFPKVVGKLLDEMDRSYSEVINRPIPAKKGKI